MSIHRKYGATPLALVLGLFACTNVSAESTQVSVKPLAEVLIHTRNTAPATVIARNESQLSAEIMARVSSVSADVGDTVRSGDLLVVLDCRDAELTLKQARAQAAATDARINMADQRLQRARELIKSRHVSADDLLSAETELALARAEAQVQSAQVGIAQRSVSKCKVRAPFDGVVRARQAQAGMLAAVGTPLLTLVQTVDREVAASLEISDADGLVSARDPVLEASGKIWPLKLDRVSDLIDTATRSRQARLAFVDDTAPIGSEGRLAWTDPTPRLPANWILRRNGELGVFVLDGDIARFKPIPGAEEGRASRVDLPADSRLIDAGRERLEDGQSVTLAAQER